MKNLKEEIQEAINLYKLQKFAEAEFLSKKLLKNNQKVAFLYNLVGLILSSQKKFTEAIQYYEKGIAVQPDYAMIYNNLGTIYKTLKKNNEAEKNYKKSIELDNKIPESHNNLGNLYIDLNKHQEAVKCFKKSIKNNSKFYVAYFNLGVLYKTLGKFKESSLNLKQAIKLYPKFYNAHRTLSQIKKYKKNDPHIDVMEKLYEDKNINNLGKIELSFALGKTYEDIKNYDESFKYFSEGNILRNKNINFSINKEIEEFNNIKKIFNKEFFKKYNKVYNNSSTPIFILGMPRSGTTLVEQILSNHPKVYGGDELNFFNDLIKSNFYDQNIFSLKYFNEDNTKKFIDIGNHYIKKVEILSNKKYRVTDKLPINFKWIGFIKLIFPKSKIIHCTRNSKDTCSSIFKNLFTNPELNYAYKLEDLVKFYNLYGDLMNYWKNNLAEFIFEIKYEELIKKPKKTISKLINNCQLDWDVSCMKFYNNKRPIKTASDIQARNKIYSSSINSWKNYKKYFEENFSKLNY